MSIKQREVSAKSANTNDSTIWLSPTVNRDQFNGSGDIALSMKDNLIDWFESNGYAWGQVATKIASAEVQFSVTKQNKVCCRLVNTDGGTIGFVNNFTPINGKKKLTVEETKDMSAVIYVALKSLVTLAQFRKPMTAEEIATDVAATATMV